jgi:putative glycosyltransferase (TIGR04372 family)
MIHRLIRETYNLIPRKRFLLIIDILLYKLCKVFDGYILLPVTLPSRIGHLLIEIDCFLKDVQLGNLPSHKYLLLLSPNIEIANRFFLDLLPKSVVVSKVSCYKIGRVRIGLFPRLWIAVSLPGLEKRFHDYAISMYATASCYQINAHWAGRSPLFKPIQSMRNAKSNFLRSIGWPLHQNFVVLHSRSSGYSPSDEHYHSLRNVKINQFDLAIDFLIKNKIYIIRIGDSTMEPCRPRDGLYDYALSNLKCPELDIALCSECIFFLGTPSGAYLMAGIFGVPLAICNICLPISFSPMGAPHQIGIPKLMRRLSTSELVPYPEIYENRSSEWRIPADFDGSDYELVENTPEEIKDLAHEALLRAQGNWQDSPEDLRRQAQFASLIRPGSYSYGTASQCGRAFMKKYEYLLGFESAFIESEQLR